MELRRSALGACDLILLFSCSLVRYERRRHMAEVTGSNPVGRTIRRNLIIGVRIPGVLHRYKPTGVDRLKVRGMPGELCSCSLEGEHLLDVEKVGGSIPPGNTRYRMPIVREQRPVTWKSCGGSPDSSRHATIAQLAERWLPKPKVTGSIPACRSIGRRFFTPETILSVSAVQ